MTKILLVDRNRLFAEGLQSAIDAKKDGFAVEGIAWDAKEAVRKVRDHRPGLILVSVRDSRQSTLNTIKALTLQCARIPLVLLSSLENTTVHLEGFKLGIRGYLRMNLSVSQLLVSLRGVLAGSLVIDPVAMTEMLNDLGLNPSAPPGTTPPQETGEEDPDRGRTMPMVGEAVPTWYHSLTRKERQILWCVVQDYQNEDIGDHLHLASQTVRNYISRIYGKLSVHNRAEAVRKARDSLLF